MTMTLVPNQLECRGLSLRYGEVQAVCDVSLTFEQGEVTAVVGANGAGKSSLLGMLGGGLRPAAGEIRLGGRHVGAKPIDEVARLGILRTFQDGQLFPAMTVTETVTIAIARRLHSSVFQRMAFLPSARRQDAAIRREVSTVLGLFGLEQLRHSRVGDLSLGQAKVVLLASVAAVQPRWALLDEPGAALARAEVPGVAAVIRSLVERDPTMGVILVEHDGELVRSVADRVVVMERGRVTADHRPSDPGWDEVLGGTIRLRKSDAPVFREVALPAGRVPPVTTETAPRIGIALSDCMVAYHRVVACRDISLKVDPGEMVSLVGSNGAGKSTILRAMMGLVQPNSGTVMIAGRDVTSASPHRRARLGLGMVAGGRGLLPELTVRENIELGTILGERRRRSRQGSVPAAVDALALFPALAHKASVPAGLLSGGEQQMVAIARSLSAAPEYLMIDELSLGLSVAVVQELMSVLSKMVSDGLALLIVDQDYQLALEHTSRCYVLGQGRLIFEGDSREALRRDNLFRPVFLGAEHAL
jgi:ABC-type branched-subunit amino acid transport system ATPase component